MERQSLILTQDFFVSQSTSRAVDKSTLSMDPPRRTLLELLLAPDID